MEKKLLEERVSKQKVENCLLEVEKRCSMLDCDLKQSQQKINELLKQKDKLNEDVSINKKLVLLRIRGFPREAGLGKPLEVASPYPESGLRRRCSCLCTVHFVP